MLWLSTDIKDNHENMIAILRREDYGRENHENMITTL